MTTSEQINEIAAALSKAQGVMKPAIKDASNPAFKRGNKESKYADLAANVEAARGPLAENGIAVIQQPTTTERGVAVSTLLAHSSGQWILLEPLTVPLSKQDAHGVGSATTYARRYALGSALGLVAEDDDGNGAVEHHDAREAVPVSRQHPTQREDEPPPVHDGNSVRVVNAKVAKEGVNDKGPWTLYAVKFSDGREGTTFSKSLYTAAQKAQRDGSDVDVTIAGKNLTALTPVFQQQEQLEEAPF